MNSLLTLDRDGELKMVPKIPLKFLIDFVLKSLIRVCLENHYKLS